MIIDIHVLIGESINGYELKPEILLARMDRIGVDLSVLSPVQPSTYRLEPENDYVAKLAEENWNRFIGFARVDPRLDELAHEELDRVVHVLGLKGLYLHPWEEGYRINDDQAISIVRHAGRLGIPVIVASGYPWVSHALQVGELAAKCPETAIIMTNGGQINISGLAQPDAYWAVKDNPNLSIETSGLYRQDFIEDIIRDFGSERVFFGSSSPKMHQEFELERAKSATVKSEEDQAKVLGMNMAKLLKLNI